MNARAVLVLLAALATSLPAFAGPNDFFGGNVGGQAAQDGAQGGQAAVNAPPTTAPPGDYTVDEKRMQKKFKTNLRDAQALKAKADGMAKSGDKKTHKKGVILQEIAEKRINELKANNPFPEIAASSKKIQ